MNAVPRIASLSKIAIEIIVYSLKNFAGGSAAVAAPAVLGIAIGLGAYHLPKGE